MAMVKTQPVTVFGHCHGAQNRALEFGPAENVFGGAKVDGSQGKNHLRHHVLYGIGILVASQYRISVKNSFRDGTCVGAAEAKN